MTIRIVVALALVLLGILAVRAWDAWRSPPLSLWHTEVPEELDADAIEKATWADWLAAEDRAFAEVRERVTEMLPESERVAANRYFAGSPLNMTRQLQDWNRTFVLEPEGTPRGAAVLIHGLTDSPYSLRHIGRHYADRGFVVIGMRMPGHGTVPAGLTRVRWEEWLAATRLAVRHARSLAGDKVPLHLVGYSNGGALALKYTLDSIEKRGFARPDQLVLISPMIGITSMARFAGVLGWPAVFPGFAKAAWLDVLPEYNPVKCNSFPVNGARQSSQLTRALDAQIARLHTRHLSGLPPTLTFQSAVDTTVSVSAVFDTLYQRLTKGGHELVLFDRNWNADVGTIIRPELKTALWDALPTGPLAYSLTIITNRPGGSTTRAHVAEEGALTSELAGIDIEYPRDLYSLSHIALPFLPDDALYGYLPSTEDVGVRLGSFATRGERGMLVVSMDNVMRASSNPFYPYLITRIDARIPREP